MGIFPAKIFKNYGGDLQNLQKDLRMSLCGITKNYKLYLGEYVAMAKVFNPHLIEAWDEGGGGRSLKIVGSGRPPDLDPRVGSGRKFPTRFPACGPVIVRDRG